jgi:hypothetical protein
MCVNINETRAKMESGRFYNLSALLGGNVSYSSDCVTGYANVTSPGRSACTIQDGCVFDNFVEGRIGIYYRQLWDCHTNRPQRTPF